jgi:hypothetical protein
MCPAFRGVGMVDISCRISMEDHAKRGTRRMLARHTGWAVRPSEFKRVVYPVGGTSRHRLPPPAGSESGPRRSRNARLRPVWGRLTASGTRKKPTAGVSLRIHIVVPEALWESADD